MRHSAVTFCLIAVSCTGALQAQPTISATQSALGRCSYETCAIRLDRSFFGSRKVMIGLEGVETSMGALGGGLVNAVDRVPTAAMEAQLGRRNSIKAAVLGVAGVLAVLYSVQRTNGVDPLEWNNGQVFGALMVGTAATFAGVVQSVYAERHFSRAVWLYNRELPR